MLQRDNTLGPDLIDGVVDTAVVVACVDQCSEPLAERTDVLLDNAPVHHSKAFIRQIPNNPGRVATSGRLVTFPRDRETSRFQVLRLDGPPAQVIDAS